MMQVVFGILELIRVIGTVLLLAVLITALCVTPIFEWKGWLKRGPVTPYVMTAICLFAAGMFLWFELGVAL
jgi:hypothetical protein